MALMYLEKIIFRQGLTVSHKKYLLLTLLYHYLLIGNPVTDGIIFGYDDHFGLVWTLLHNGICLQPFAQFHSFPLDGFR